jgi:hypothetical protein
VNETQEDAVTTYPPEKAFEGEAVLLKFQTRSVKFYASGFLATWLGISAHSCCCCLRPPGPLIGGNGRFWKWPSAGP